ncbi:MAG: ABC transporter ATP-binding protein [Butyrivibrio sp.]|nr:ABC transporter ATP-binding protein [Butyrivibrio sp.]
MIKCVDISKSYKNGKNIYPVLKKLNLEIEKGGMTAILGKSGSGKSTLLNIIGTLDSPTSGECIVDGVHLENMSEREKARFRNKRLGFVMQDYSLVNHQSALFNIMLPLYFTSESHSKMKKKAHATAELVGIEELTGKRVVDLSGGEKQRVAIARAIVAEPSIILADEPTGALDTKTSEQIIELLRSISGTGKTIVIVTHDLNVANHCDRIVSLKDGQVVSHEQKTEDKGQTADVSRRLKLDCYKIIDDKSIRE